MGTISGISIGHRENILAVDPSVQESEIDIIDSPGENSFVHLQACLFGYGADSGIETIGLSLGGEALAEIVVTQVAESDDVVVHFDRPKQRVGVVAGSGGVI
ncbi:hypothetical protein GCM10023322_84330 [Rugosimonospora acidiphila]|uniref:Uncharacterized protein n=1 Tax=Rugosimonospora acidiphila TaxID=556531 RepID=A0ABP9ST40_9ACTN